MNESANRGVDELAVLAFDHAPIGMVVSERRIILHCNQALAEMFGFTPLELVGRSLALLYPSHEEFVRIGALGLERMRDTGRYHDERIMARRDGDLFWCRVRGRSLSPGDPFARAVWTFADISPQRPIVALSERDRQIAMLVGQGQTAKTIARALALSHRTVEAYLTRLRRKLGVRNMAELAARLAGAPG